MKSTHISVVKPNCKIVWKWWSYGLHCAVRCGFLTTWTPARYRSGTQSLTIGPEGGLYYGATPLSPNPAPPTLSGCCHVGLEGKSLR